MFAECIVKCRLQCVKSTEQSLEYNVFRLQSVEKVKNAEDRVQSKVKNAVFAECKKSAACIVSRVHIQVKTEVFSE